MTRKKKWALVAVVAMCCALLGAGSAAFFTASATATNVITSGSVDIRLNEWAAVEPERIPFTEVTGVMPGQTVPKYVEVENTGLAPAYVRVRVEKRIDLAEGAQGTADPSLITLDLNGTDWTERDGFYYYNRPLAPGERTTYLLTGVTFAGAMGNLYRGCRVTVEVAAQATQVAHNGATALEAAGWPEA